MSMHGYMETVAVLRHLRSCVPYFHIQHGHMYPCIAINSMHKTKTVAASQVA